MRGSRRLALVASLLALLGAVAAWALSGDRAKDRVGLFTTLPIYWAESGDITEAIDGGGAPHWARSALESDYDLVPLDTLDKGDLAPLRRLVMAQPRPLGPAENVALDDWVRRGGRVLIFADPMLTGHSRFAIGDRRRPQDVVLISPILARWGLELRYDEDQGDAERMATVGGRAVPVRHAGEFALRAGGRESACNLDGGGLVARCRIGKGHATVVADAALLETERAPEAETLMALVRSAFAD